MASIERNCLYFSRLFRQGESGFAGFQHPLEVRATETTAAPASERGRNLRYRSPAVFVCKCFDLRKSKLVAEAGTNR